MDSLASMNFSLTLLEQEECESLCARYLIEDAASLPASQLAQMRREGLLDAEDRPGGPVGAPAAAADPGLKTILSAEEERRQRLLLKAADFLQLAL